MKSIKTRRGFTIIEVSLFLAISGFLIAGLLIGTGTTIARQRYNDSVQNFAEFLRSQYSAVINVENGRTDSVASQCVNPLDADAGVPDPSHDTDRGRTSCLIYGKLITIGEAGIPNPDSIYSYTVIGSDVADVGMDAGIFEALYEAGIRVKDEDTAAGTCSIIDPTEYTPQWGARIEDEDGNLLELTILIVRSPLSGSVHTYILDEAISVYDPGSCDEEMVIEQLLYTNGRDNTFNASASDPNNTAFEEGATDLCVSSDDILSLLGNNRRDIRLKADGRNATAVELIAQDDEGENRCL
jgi:type II secretory pathway pseudopilin PulG